MGAERRRGGPLQAQLQSPHLRNPNFGRPFSPHLLERERVRVWRFCGCPCVGAGLGVGTASVLHGIFRDLNGNSRIPRSARGWDGRTRGFHSFGLKEWGWGGEERCTRKGGGGNPPPPPPTRTTQRHRAGITNSNSKKTSLRIGERAEVRDGGGGGPNLRGALRVRGGLGEGIKGDLGVGGGRRGMRGGEENEGAATL